MTPLTPQQLDDLERLQAEATPGPWRWDGRIKEWTPRQRDPFADFGADIDAGPEDAPTTVVQGGAQDEQGGAVGVLRGPDARLIAESRNALPAVLAAARREARLREALERLVEGLEVTAQREGERTLLGDPAATMARTETLTACAESIRRLLAEDDQPTLEATDERDDLALIRRQRAGELEMSSEQTPMTAWIDRLQRVMDAAPQGIWLYAASGQLYVMALDPDGSRMLTDNGGMDQEAIIALIRTPEIDGGDW